MTNVTETYLISALVIESAVFFIALLVSMFSGHGKRIIKRLKQRFMYRLGKHVNVIFVRNNRVAHEAFIAKNSDGSFTVNDERYTVNALCTFNFDGIPTQITQEGITEPLNVFNDSSAELMTTAEIEKIIMNNEVGNLAAILKKYLPLFIIFICVMFVMVAVLTFFNYKIYDTIAQKHILDLLKPIAQAAVNSTSVVAR